jgi:H+/Cl- antiporter ClcA
VVPFKILSSFIALLSGASIGPEAILATIGSALGCITAISFRFSSLEQKSMILSGIAAALGAIFPSPYLGILCAVELSIVSGGQVFNLNNLYNLGSDLMTSGQQNGSTSSSLETSTRQNYHTIMEQISLMVITSTVSVLTLSLFHKPRSSIVSSIDSEHLSKEEEESQIFIQTAQAVVLGCLCGLLGCLYLILQGTLKAISQDFFRKLLHPFDVKRYWLATLISPLVTGVTYGLIAFSYPLTLGNGYEYSRLLFTLWKKNENAKVIFNDDEILAADLLFVSALLKLLSSAACLGLGMFGGQIIPLMVAGVYLGFSLAFCFPFLSVTLAIACCSISIAGSFVPIPFTMVATVASIWGVAGATTVPVILSLVCAYAANAGLGTVLEIARRKTLISIRVDTEEQSAEIL